MREDEAGRSHTPWRWHPWFKRISNATAHVSAATLLAAGVANGLAARKHKSRNDHRDRREQANTDEDRGNERNRGDKPGNDPKEDGELQREQKHRSDGAGDGGKHDQGVKQERRSDGASDDSSTVDKKQNSNQDSGTTGGNEDTTTGTGDTTTGNEDTTTGGGGGDAGHRAGNAGSGLFDNPLATKARRRAKDFDNADRDQDDGTFVDVRTDDDSVYETDSVSLVTGPDGLEIVTGNITYVAEPTPIPEPLPGLELPDREPGFPFGEDFPFGNATVVIAPTSAEPSDRGDTGTDTASRAKFIPSQPEPSSDGGDNTMDFTS
jgi:hypothetical protein